MQSKPLLREKVSDGGFLIAQIGRESMNETTKEWRAAYMRLRAARQRAAIVQARIELSRDIHTGMKIVEVSRLAECKLRLEEARFEAVARPHERELVDDAFESATNLIVAYAGNDVTAEFSSALDDLLRESQAARDAWKQTKDDMQGIA
jgi:hypothetical protein